MPNRTSGSFGGFLITLAGAVLSSTKAILVKKAFADTKVDALSLLTIRMMFSLPFFLAAAWLISSKIENVRLTLKQWLMVAVLGLSGNYLSGWLDFEGLQYVSAGLERLILFLYPTFVVLINLFVFREKITKGQVVALVLTYTGIGLAYFSEMRFDTANPYFLLGSVLIFLCSVTYAIYLSGGGRIIPFIGASKFTAYAMLAGTFGISIHFIIRGDYQGLKAGGSEMWVYGVMLALVATVIPAFLLSVGISKIGSNNAAIVSGIGPVSTIMQAHWILGERIHVVQIVGTALVIAGVLITGWKSQDVVE